MAADGKKSPSGTRLTGRSAGLLLLSLAVTVTGAVIPEPDAVRIGLFGMLLVPLTWPLARRNLRGLRIVRKLPESCFAGQLFSMDLELVNEKPRLDSVAVELEDGIAGPAERGLTARWLRSRGRVSRTLTTRLLRRGVSHRIRSMLTSTFPLGLWRSRLEVRDSADVIVYPRPVTPRSLEEATDSAMIDTDEAESAHRDWMGDFHGVRSFQPGDRLKLIHWPTTARSGSRLMVRQFDRPLPEKYFVVFHSIFPGRQSGERGDAFESAMELLCGLLMYCRDHCIPLDLVASFDEWRCLPVSTPPEVEEALYRLAAARRNGERDASNLLRALSGVERHTRVFLVSDVPVKDWEPMLPDLPFAVTCLSVSDLRIRRPGLVFKVIA
jgi:uncharacterized protein (DUF58 family)